MRIGIIGTENSHAAAINVEKKVKGFSVDYVWGEAEEFTKKTVAAGQIPHVVETPREMLARRMH